MRRIKLDNVYESPTPLENINNLWGDIDENTGELLAIHKYNPEKGEWEPNMVSVDYIKPDNSDESVIVTSLSGGGMNLKGMIPYTLKRKLTSSNPDSPSNFDTESWFIILPEEFEAVSSGTNLLVADIDSTSKVAYNQVNGHTYFTDGSNNYYVHSLLSYFIGGLITMGSSMTHKVLVVTKAQFDEFYDVGNNCGISPAPMFALTLVKKSKDS